MRRFLSLVFIALSFHSSAQEQRIGDTTATGIVTYSLRAINGKGIGNRPAVFDSLGKLVPDSSSNIPGIVATYTNGLIHAGDSLYFGSPSAGPGPHNFTTDRHQYLNGHYYSIGGSAKDPLTRPAFRVYDNGDFTFGAENKLTGNTWNDNNGIRYTAKYGVLEVGTQNNFDTSLVTTCCNSFAKSAIVINADEPNLFKGHIHDALIATDGTTVDSAGTVVWSALFGEAHYIGSRFNKSIGSGSAQNVSRPFEFSILSGANNTIVKNVHTSLITGLGNYTADSSLGSLVSGVANSFGGYGQFVAGTGLTNKTPSGTAIGNRNVDFTSLGYTAWRGVNGTADLKKYPIFSIGNNKNSNTGNSNAITVLFNGRTQINTTGYDNTLSEADVTPEAALDIVSTNSGILIPRLTTAQKDSIASGDLHNGLLLYNTDSAKFQYYNGSSWNILGAGTGSSTAGWGVAGNTGSPTQFIGTTNSQSLILKANNIEGMRIFPTGQIGVGVGNITGFPGEDANIKLFIEGWVKARTIKVDADTWADYVFSKQYQLPGLKEVEAFIKKHQHLPGVPSATEVKDKGLDLGANQAVLLKKIEELTLYAIEQNKNLEEQKQLNNTLLQRLAALEEKLK
jgi:hypothetical protein